MSGVWVWAVFVVVGVGSTGQNGESCRVGGWRETELSSAGLTRSVSGSRPRERCISMQNLSLLADIPDAKYARISDEKGDGS